MVLNFMRSWTVRIDRYKLWREARIIVVGLLIFIMAVDSVWESFNCKKMFCTTMNRSRIDVTYMWFLSGAMYWLATKVAVFEEGPVVVRVNSTGGSLLMAKQMGQWTERLDDVKGVRMEVGPNDRCMSACVYFWSSARKRWANPAAQFVFHGPGWGLSRRAGPGLEHGAALMEEGVRRVDAKLADLLKGKGAFAPAGDDVPLTAAEIAVLGGDYLRLDPALR